MEKNKEERVGGLMPLQLSGNADLSASCDISHKMLSHSRACIMSWEIYKQQIFLTRE